MKRLATLALLGLLVAQTASARIFLGTEAFRRGDYATALKELRPPAEQGNTEALLLLGKMLSAGLGVTRDPKKAVAYFRRAAEGGSVDAQYEYGAALALGEGVRQDIVQGLKWLILAARGGHQGAREYTKRLAKYMSGDILRAARKAALLWQATRAKRAKPAK